MWHEFCANDRMPIDTQACIHRQPLADVLTEVNIRPDFIGMLVLDKIAVGILNQVKGLICGSFTGCEEDPLMPVKLWDNFKMIVEPYGIPLWLGSPIGHDINNFPVVEG